MLLVAWWWLRPHPPTYQGRDVRGWLVLHAEDSRTSDHGHYGVMPDVVRAFRRMGTNAIPPLLAVASESGPAPEQSAIAARARSWLAKAVGSLSQPLARRLDGWLGNLLGPDPDLSGIALAALEELRPSASLLLPPCTRLVASPNPDRRRMGLRLLGCVGDEPERAAAVLAPFLESADYFDAWQSLRKLGPAGAGAVPQLMAWLASSDSYRAKMAVPGLESIGPGASNALPLLRRRFEAQRTEAERLGVALGALAVDPTEFWMDGPFRDSLAGKYDNWNFRTAKVLDTVRRLTNATPRYERELGLLARSGRVEESGMIAQLNNTAWLALDALCRANIDPARKIPVAIDCLTSTNAVVRIAAAGWLLDFQPTNTLAFAGVTNALANSWAYGEVRSDENPEVAREWLLARLVRLGPAAAPALPLLLQLHSHASGRDRWFLADAIEAIEIGR